MHPRLAEIPTPWGPLVVQTHGALLALALLAGWYLFTRPAHEVSARERGRVFLAMALVGLLGAKLVRAASREGVLFEGGVDALGFLLGGAFVIGASHRELARLAAPIGALVAAAIALGEHLAGARFGLVASEPAWLVVRYPRWADGLGSPAWRAHLEAGRIDLDAASSLSTLPVPLLDATLAFALFLATARAPRHAPAIVLGLYALGRLALDRFRASPSIVDAVAAAVVLGVALVSLRRASPATPPPATPPPATPPPASVA